MFTSLFTFGATLDVERPHPGIRIRFRNGFASAIRVRTAGGATSIILILDVAACSARPRVRLIEPLSLIKLHCVLPVSLPQGRSVACIGQSTAALFMKVAREGTHGNARGLLQMTSANLYPSVSTKFNQPPFLWSGFW